MEVKEALQIGLCQGCLLTVIIRNKKDVRRDTHLCVYAVYALIVVQLCSCAVVQLLIIVK